jgi:membrane protease YdiL (CAAX protease family)
MALTAATGAVLFGLANWAQGPVGVLAGVATGGILNLLFYWERHSVWPTVLAQSVFSVLAIGLSL